jgi:hypothetical protein
MRMLSLTPGGTSAAYLVYISSGTYPRQDRGEVSCLRRTFAALRRKKMVDRSNEYTHVNWSLSTAGSHVVHLWLCRSHRTSIVRFRTGVV